MKKLFFLKSQTSFFEALYYTDSNDELFCLMIDRNCKKMQLYGCNSEGLPLYKLIRPSEVIEIEDVRPYIRGFDISEDFMESYNVFFKDSQNIAQGRISSLANIRKAIKDLEVLSA
ncbi:hypothetical protein [Halobacteriovorax sp. ZH2_bin.1]|uniref:hypothetical protein n=1 Tax=Halobacteriovorax sp. ZH2_bin.1 TaxID=3157724 RepID=UPI0037225737